ncbi:alanine acetyltransferase [Acrocarpospora corrugata]|uniref:Alanine acetyltransferase n=1 Tax=Acrocarpospora corrugata TaxID=35763 RepID=A0A5M3W5X8_9ACTN|nr:GNAT family protein [Acrocarpospora corrugata]GES02673.1 alanine acetyltransferase [Acrocarpospora corrugata]
MRVTLRPVRVMDLDVFDRERTTPEGTGEFQWFGHRTSHSLRREFAENGLLGHDSGRLTIDADGQPGGWVTWWMNSWGPDATSWCWTIGICVFADFRGKGAGSEAQRQLVAYLFAHTRAERVQSFTDAGNFAEQRALEKAGFTREGTLRHAQWRDGRWHDQVLFSAIRP